MNKITVQFFLYTNKTGFESASENGNIYHKRISAEKNVHTLIFLRKPRNFHMFISKEAILGKTYIILLLFSFGKNTYFLLTHEYSKLAVYIQSYDFEAYCNVYIIGHFSNQENFRNAVQFSKCYTIKFSLHFCTLNLFGISFGNLELELHSFS